jgi:dTDP-4-dehydrorhamnose reductase
VHQRTKKDRPVALWVDSPIAEIENVGRLMPAGSPGVPRILIVGATGQVGRALTGLLAPAGELITTARTPAILPVSVPCHQLDVTDLDAVCRTVHEVRPAVIVNAVAYTAVDRAESEPQLAMTINGIVPGVLAEEARRINAAIVHYSTDYVFDGSGTRAWAEGDRPAPLNEYGRSKLAGEESIRASGAAHAILRISWIYAAHGQNFVKTMLRLAGERKELRIVDDQIGAPTPAAQVAFATSHILGRVRRSPATILRELGGTFHVPCGGETSWHGFAEEIFRLARAAGMPLRVERVVPITTAEFPTPARRPLNSRLDSRLAAERFGLRLPDWSTALAAEFPAISALMR